MATQEAVTSTPVTPPPPAATTAAPPPPAATKPSTPTPTTDTGTAAQAATQQAKTEDVKPAEGQGEPAKADEATKAGVEVKLPDGFEADAESLESFKAWAKEKGLASAEAQKVVDYFVQSTKASQVKQEAAWTKQVSDWGEQLKADKEFGGAKFDENVSVAKRALDKFATKELREYFDKSGLGNHPEFFRAFYRIGKAFADDSVAGANAAGSSRGTAEAALLDMYPSMKPKE